jgi:hypothetical protein
MRTSPHRRIILTSDEIQFRRTVKPTCRTEERMSPLVNWVSDIRGFRIFLPYLEPSTSTHVSVLIWGSHALLFIRVFIFCL